MFALKQAFLNKKQVLIGLLRVIGIQILLPFLHHSYNNNKYKTYKFKYKDITCTVYHIIESWNKISMGRNYTILSCYFYKIDNIVF